MSYSKILTILSITIFALTVICGIMLSVKGYDTSLFNYIISTSGGVWGLTMVSYFKKASLENNIKIQLGMLEDILKLKSKYQDSDIDVAIDKVETRLNNIIDSAIDDSTIPPDLPNF